MGISIQESNYLKESELSGDEVRKSCTGKLTVNGQQIYETSHRDYESCYRKIQNFILAMEDLWWFLKEDEREKQIGRIIGYREQLFKIQSFDVECAAMTLKTLDGEARKPFMWEDPKEDQDEFYDTVRTLITSDAITWFPHGLKGHVLNGETK